ncbi:MAG: calcium-binding protein, partial [bacterium]|nr:calcium-binding protein [bacterium]
MNNIDDSDTAGITVSAISGDTQEDGSSAVFTVVLTSEPTGNVVLDISSIDTGEGTVSPAILTFTTDNWNANQTVTVTGVDDDVADGNQSFTVQLTVDTDNTADTTGYAAFDPDDVTVINIDDESAGFIISEISNDTVEDGTTATFTVKLTSEPDGDVALDVASSDTGEGAVSPVSLTFTADNWEAEQTVTATGVDDDVADDNQTFTVQLAIDTDNTTDTTGYAGLGPDDVEVINIDDESAGFIISEISNDTVEDGTTGSFTMKLTSEPNSDVVLDVACSDTGEGTILPAILTFTADNWEAEQTVTVTGVDDDVADGNQSFTVQLTVDTDNTADTTG